VYGRIVGPCWFLSLFCATVLCFNLRRRPNLCHHSTNENGNCTKTRVGHITHHFTKLPKSAKTRKKISRTYKISLSRPYWTCQTQKLAAVADWSRARLSYHFYLLVCEFLPRTYIHHRPKCIMNKLFSAR